MTWKFGKPWQYGDPFEDETVGWPKAIQDRHWQVICAFEDGNPKPLGDYIDSGFRITREIALRLLFAIQSAGQGKDCPPAGPVKLTLKRTNKDRGPYSDRVRAYDRNVKIGVEIELRLRADPSLARADAVSDVATEFGIGKTLAEKALSSVRRQLKFAEVSIPYLDLVALAPLRTEESDDYPHPKRRVRVKKLSP